MDRPPIVFLHGAFSNADHFSGWVELFSRAGFQCFAPSLPGHDSNDSHALQLLTLKDYFVALRDDISKLRSPPVMIGHSMGGLLAQQLAAILPCKALVCFAAVPPWMLVPPIRALPFFAPMIPAILAGGVVRPTETTFRRIFVNGLLEDEQRRCRFALQSGTRGDWSDWRHFI